MIKALVFTRKCYVTDIKWLYHMYIYIQQNELQSDHEDIFRISRVYPWSLIFILNCERPSLLSCYQYISWEHRDSSFVARSLRLPGVQFMTSWRRAKTVVIPVQNDCINIYIYNDMVLFVIENGFAICECCKGLRNSFSKFPVSPFFMSAIVPRV